MPKEVWFLIKLKAEPEMKRRNLFHCKVVYKQCRALLWDLLLHLRTLVSPGERRFPCALAEDHGVTTDRQDTRYHGRAALTLLLLAPVTYEPARVSEQSASWIKGKIILYLTWNSCFSILRQQAQFILVTYISPITQDYYQDLRETHFRCNLTYTLIVRVIMFALWQAWNTSIVLFPHLWGKRTENSSSIFWQKHLLSTVLEFLKDLHSKIHLQFIPPPVC